MTDDDRERRIRARAYQIWIEAGQPFGKEREHWDIAKDEIAREGDLTDQGEGEAPAYEAAGHHAGARHES